MNTNTIAFEAFTSYYCALCSSVISNHICLDCNDYALTFVEAVTEGHL